MDMKITILTTVMLYSLLQCGAGMVYTLCAL